MPGAGLHFTLSVTVCWLAPLSRTAWPVIICSVSRDSSSQCLMDSDVETRLENFIRGKLAERFKDDFVFDPILVRKEVDEYGDPYLHTYIVYKGDDSKWDTRWRLSLTWSVWPLSIELGYDNMPMQSYIEKSDWLEDPHTLQERW